LIGTALILVKSPRQTQRGLSRFNAGFRPFSMGNDAFSAPSQPSPGFLRILTMKEHYHAAISCE
jgi:hypothetical protein